MVPWEVMPWFSCICFCVIVRNHYFPSLSSFLLGKKQVEEDRGRDAGRWKQRELQALWYPVEAFLIGLDYPSKQLRCLCLQASPLQSADALTISIKLRGMVSAPRTGSPYDSLRCSLLSMTVPLTGNCERGSSNEKKTPSLVFKSAQLHP